MRAIAVWLVIIAIALTVWAAINPAPYRIEPSIDPRHAAAIAHCIAALVTWWLGEARHDMRHTQSKG